VNQKLYSEHFLERCWLAVAAMVALFSSCDLTGAGGGGGGLGGDGDGTVNFTKGYVFTRKDDRNVYVVDSADLTVAGRLTNSGGVSMPRLSKDGRTVVFARKNGAESEIDVVPVAGGTVRVVLASSSGASNLRTPVWSPDGASIAFTFDRGGQSRLGIVNVDGSNFRQLVATASLSYAFPAFSVDGRLLYAAAGASPLALSQIEQIDVGTGMAQNVANTLGNEAMSIHSRIALSPDGQFLAFDARVASSATRIFVYDLPGRKAPTKANEYANEPNTNDSAPCWLDANTVGFSSDSGGNDNLYQVLKEGTGRKLLLPKVIEPTFGPTP
jgi:TolB protein